MQHLTPPPPKKKKKKEKENFCPPLSSRQNLPKNVILALLELLHPFLTE